MKWTIKHGPIKRRNDGVWKVWLPWGEVTTETSAARQRARQAAKDQRAKRQARRRAERLGRTEVARASLDQDRAGRRPVAAQPIVRTVATPAAGSRRLCGQPTADGKPCRRVVVNVPCPEHPAGRPASQSGASGRGRR